MRVVGGELRGRRLRAPRGGEVRPTSDRAREAIFSMLGDVAGARALDLFCGTGALGIEAVSRGAVGAVLVDSRLGSARRNVSELGLGDRCRLVESDALAFLRSGEDRFDLVFCDPPYRLADRLGSELDRLLPRRLAPGARVIVESSARRPLRLSLPVARERSYGEALVRLHREPGG